MLRQVDERERRRHQRFTRQLTGHDQDVATCRPELLELADVLDVHRVAADPTGQAVALMFRGYVRVTARARRDPPGTAEANGLPSSLPEAVGGSRAGAAPPARPHWAGKVSDRDRNPAQHQPRPGPATPRSSEGRGWRRPRSRPLPIRAIHAPAPTSGSGTRTRPRRGHSCRARRARTSSPCGWLGNPAVGHRSARPGRADAAR